MRFERQVQIEKVDPEQRMVWGWAYVCEEGGCQVVDHSGDIVEPEDVQKAAHGFISDSRTGGVLHQAEAGTIVDSIFFSPAVQRALRINLGKVGWFVGFRVDDDDAWQAVKDGRYAAFSIAGSAVSEPVDKAYNPDQPREDDGKFASGGGGGGGGGDGGGGGGGDRSGGDGGSSDGPKPKITRGQRGTISGGFHFVGREVEVVDPQVQTPPGPGGQPSIAVHLVGHSDPNQSMWLPVAHFGGGGGGKTPGKTPKPAAGHLRRVKSL